VLSHLLVFFLKTDSLTFGSGLVIVPFLEKDLVQQTAWLNGSEFLVAGFRASLASTIEIFLPSLFLIVAVAPILLRHRANPNVQGFVKGAYAPAIGTIVGACMPPGQTAHCTYSRRRSRALVPLESKQSTAHRRDREVASESENRRQDSCGS
jgi:hypothetical protein